MSFKNLSDKEKIKALNNRYKELVSVRSKWLEIYKDITRYISPFSGKYGEKDLDNRSYKYIYDDEGAQCLNILVSGLLSGSTSPLREWFRLQAPTNELQKNKDIDLYFYDCETVINRVFHQSNTYNSLHQFYNELCLYGTAVDILLDDNVNAINHYVLTAGEYCIATNDKGVVDTLYREFYLTVAQAIKKFDIKKLSIEIQNCYKRGNLEQKFKFIHAIEPRVDRDLNSSLNVNMAWGSYYFQDGTDVILKESGFNQFPCLVARWNVIGADPYGISPSIQALPDIKQLQFTVKRGTEYLDKFINPPVQLPFQARMNPINLGANGKNFVPSTDNINSAKPIYQLPNASALIKDEINELKNSINRKFFVDMFLMLKQSTADRKTTAEVFGLQEEQRLILGGVTERLAKEVQSPLVKFTFARCLELGYIEPLPPELENIDFDVQVQSVFSQAQRAVDINAYDRFISTTQSLSASDPSVIDKINFDTVIDEYADRLGVSPSIIRDQKDVESIREARAQQVQQQQAIDSMPKVGQGVQALSNAQNQGANASLATQNLDPIEQLIL